MDDQHQQIIRQGIAGLLWSKQFYHYSVRDWLTATPRSQTAAERLQGRNTTGRTSSAATSFPCPTNGIPCSPVDLAFHMIRFRSWIRSSQGATALMLREWYMHPSAKSSYEFPSTSQPPSTPGLLRVYKLTAGAASRSQLLAQTFHNCSSIHLVGQPPGSEATSLARFLA